MDTQNPIFTMLVKPINDVSTAIRNGGYRSHFPKLTTEIVGLRNPTTDKEVFVPIMDNPFHSATINAMLEILGLKPCLDGPNYLFGLMAALRNKSLPVNFDNITIIAAEVRNTPTVFKFDACHSSLVAVDCGTKASQRELLLIGQDGMFEKNKYAIIAERI
jgi:hypothetical protein